jgi:LPS sulfotransferase NodH
MLWHQLPSVTTKLKASLGDQGAVAERQSLHSLLTEKLGEPRYIWLRRKNKLAQAISYYRASRTGLWRSVDTHTGPREVADRELPFDYGLIDQYLQAVNAFDARWYDYFRRHHVKVLMLFYENFDASCAQTALGVLHFLRISRDNVVVSEPRLRRQADARSLEWEQRFIEMRKAGGANVSQAVAGRVLEPGRAEAAERPLRSKRPKRITAHPAEPPLPLVAYALAQQTPALVTAPSDRDWMDATPKRFAYRCLPMVMANQAGWLVLNRHKLAVTWNGGVEPEALKIQFLSGQDPRSALSIFGSGILTFMMGYLFRTPRGYNIYVHGPANSPKDGVAALEGIAESDWTEATFTMNWKLTRPNHPVVFEENEPIAMLTGGVDRKVRRL